MSLSPSVPVLRRALGDDLKALQDLARRTIDASYRWFLGDEGVDRFLDSGASDDHIETHFRQGHVRCMEVDGDLVGLLILEGPTVDLMMIDVRRHRQGWGRILLAHAEETLFTQYDELRLESFAGNLTANAFYEACGWQETGSLESKGPAKIEFVRHRVVIEGLRPATRGGSPEVPRYGA
ncbi:GNAT family N-acetyltransferase [Streptomyces hirsutus]|uniref:GNAT family N-acetyltransferase n=1 Tax=Streptomyces hirsutus TaxID=35620 RepID=UPI0036CE74B6